VGSNFFLILHQSPVNVSHFDHQALVLDQEPVVVRSLFEWKCSDKCSCLPSERDDVVYMHQSSKTDNQTLWHGGWSTFRQSWLDHHMNDGWVFVFWLDKHNDLLAKCMGYYEKLFQGRSSIQRADLSRLLYMYKYGVSDALLFRMSLLSSNSQKCNSTWSIISAFSYRECMQILTILP
jgi:hypothetical protein